MIDLHSHSTASDGTFTPSQLVQHAASKKISVMAITDHDTTAGIAEAVEEGKKSGITVVPGIELSIQWPTGEFHLLGLGLQKTSKELNKICKFLNDERIDRNKRMALRLQEQGIAIDYDELCAKFNTKNLGRPHFAQYMMEKGIVKTRQQAFDRYFAKGRPCYVERTGADLEESVEAIISSGGIPVQAHPMSMYVAWGKLENTMKGILEKGILGLEAWYPGVRVAEAERLEKMAHDFGIIATAGSDFHGEKVRADRHMGYTAGKKKIDDRFWTEELKPALEKAHGTLNLDYKE